VTASRAHRDCAGDGETGTGKELVARTIPILYRTNMRWWTSTAPPARALVESELFGYEK